ncbi:zinc ribbon domain-containing protein [Pleionea sp. CnH1-48]|uniref:zinc ribbon domain-containing protein n=1 Tax=Pleionea sp. CnH1-48 TaxID=2954494 RepID=UPI00209835E7|nr:zinc ribbon domain-containing protein [Pleionea sp. CnH1-48]MCO7226954.1 zinc ribbon domain-containing protein [Pleionea sp. CnH1-48]
MNSKLPEEGIRNCPGCNRELSDKATECLMCGHKFEAANPDRERAKAHKALKRKNRYHSMAYLAMVLVCAGALFIYFGRKGSNETFLLFGYGSLGLGAASYLWARAMMFVHKKKK